MNNSGPVGVFDSGLGGISVLKEILRELPDEDCVFYGDSKNAPYGVRSDEEVWELTEHVFLQLLKKNVKAVVIACNTATSVAVRKLRAQYPSIPVIGMEPAIKPAVQANPGGRVVVMATPVTLRRPKFVSLMKKYEEHAEIVPLECPEIVRYVEEGRIHDEALRIYIQDRFDTIGSRPADAVVLGCTHFPFAADLIREVAGPRAELFDGSEGTARELRHRMEDAGLLAETGRTRRVEIMNSAGELPAERARMLLEGKL